ncbi:MAG: hypothetical protein ACE5KA_06880 [Nitrososphaerales archaeon]
MLDLYSTLRMVEDEIAEMKKRQQTVLAGYQQQTREDIVKKFDEGDHTLLQSAEQKVIEINSLKHNTPYLVTSSKKVSYVSVRRVTDESGLTIEIEPIIYPTPFNLKFVFNEPSVGLYAPSMERGIFSVNTVTSIRATDIIQTIEVPDLHSYLDLWITHKTDNSFVTKLKTMRKKIMNADSSTELLVESMLAMSSPMPPRQLIYLCEDHDREPTHKHEKTVSPSAVKELLKHHFKLN